MSIDIIKQFVQTLAGAAQSMRLYPSKHPLVSRQLDQCGRHLLLLFQNRQTLRLGLNEGMLFCDNYLFNEANPALIELGRLLDSLALDGLELHSGVKAEELAAIFSLAGQGSLKGAELEQAFKAHEILHVIPLHKNPEDEDTRAVFKRAMLVAEKICQDVANGRTPSGREAAAAVRSLVAATLKNPHAMLALTLIKDYDNYTFQHSVNVAAIAITVGQACGASEEQMEILGLGGLLHDLGKLKVDINIINKPGRLTAEEFEAVKLHPVHGAGIAEQMDGISPQVIDIVRGHHLHYNRKGYPDDMAGRPMPPLVDMAAIADSFDAITTMRAYRRPVSPRQAAREMRQNAGTMLHPQFLEKFLRFLGPYPVGTAVRLDNGEIALVMASPTHKHPTLRLKVLLNKEGTAFAQPFFIDLREAEFSRIVSEVNPFLFGIELNDHF